MAPPLSLQKVLKGLAQVRAGALSTAPATVSAEDANLTTALENDLGTWFGKKCYLTKSGSAAVVAVMRAACTAGIPVYVDQFLQMSFYDAAVAAGGKTHTFKLNTVDDLEAKILKYGPGIIIVESAAGVSGIWTPLKDIVRVKKVHNCLLVVDESHALGLVGPQGLGVLHHHDLVNEADYITASLANGFSTLVGVVFTSGDGDAQLNPSAPGLVTSDIVRLRAIWGVIKAADNHRDRMAKVMTFVSGYKPDTPRAVCRLKPADNATVMMVRMKTDDEITQLHRGLLVNGLLADPSGERVISKKRPALWFLVRGDVSAEMVNVVLEAVKNSSRRPASL
ncbi:pyridoxal phosphate-dependent transferase [Aspergillus egyptiacus]|nr:pyridoxal phosphate-dependent transferase [Aspergillus egyptiacus]